ncbi:GNAT family N-acetyltransferase [Kordiimonas sp.]|uniref:GNAT family N-acetyltransferase n=1 Tax=Kordiimonas sp. TaxID=1970157 RepID=UPI003B524857
MPSAQSPARSHDQITVQPGPIDPTHWHALPEGTPIPLQQHWLYGLALQSVGVPIYQWQIEDTDGPLGFALVARRRFLRLVSFDTLLRGPLYFRDRAKSTNAVHKALRRKSNPWRWRFLLQQPELLDDTATTQALKTAGLRQVATGYSTAWLDLRPEPGVLRAALVGKWRTQLRAAEKADMQISIGGHKAHHYAWLLEKEAAQRSARSYQATPLELVPLYQATAEHAGEPGILSVTAMSGRRRIAGAIFLLHGNSATYHMGWVGEEGRSTGAQNRVLFEAMCALRQKGISFLDLGGINTAEGAGIARFKLGTGAAPVTYTGSWI